MAITITDGVRNGGVTGATDLFNSGVIRIYDGTVPANAGTALTTQNLLAEVSLDASAWNAASAGSRSLADVPISDNSINASGTATFFRMVGAVSTNVLQGTVNTSAADMIVDNTSFVLGGVFTINSLSVTLPAG